MERDAILSNFKNRLRLYGGKTELLVVGNRKQFAKMPNLSADIGNGEIKPSDNVPNFSVVLDANLSLNSNVNSLCSSVRYYWRNVGLARKSFTK